MTQENGLRRLKANRTMKTESEGLYIQLILAIHIFISCRDSWVFPSHMDDKILDAPSAEAMAMLALGRLDGALGQSSATVQRIFAAHVLRDVFITALRQEGHLFTDRRFNAWFAGLATLSDSSSRHARPPRALCDGIVTELAHSSCEPLAQIAVRIKPALLAPQDLQPYQSHTQTQAVIEDAHLLLEPYRRDRSDLPFASLSRLHHDISRSVRFAPVETRPSPITLQNRHVMIEHRALPSPRWAIELLYGECLRASGFLQSALPLPGLVRLDALEPKDANEARLVHADALQQVSKAMFDRLSSAVALAHHSSLKLPGQRGTSRSPLLFELLAGFGPMRSTQIENVFSATRLGVRSMVASLADRHVLARETVAGSHLYSISLGSEAASIAPKTEADRAFSADALNDFDASLAHLDRLLGRDERQEQSTQDSDENRP